MTKFKSSLALKLLFALFFVLATPAVAFAHDGDGQTSVIVGGLAWGFLGFGVLVIGVVSVILFAGNARRSRAVTAMDFESLTGLSGYIAKMRLFSRNARLFMVHVVGMDVIFGTWNVLFNLYLLAVGFDIAFIGLRIPLAAVTRAVFSIPAGLISDRMGRKLSFILGDGMGAVISLMAIPFILLIALSPDVGSALGSVLTVAGLAHIARITFMNMASPVRSAFAMEILDPGERGTQVGIELALASGLSGLASYAGAQLMNAGDFRTPFFLMAGCILAANLMFWRFFARHEGELVPVPVVAGAEAVITGD